MDGELKKAIAAKLEWRLGLFHMNQAILADIEALIDTQKQPEWDERLKDPVVREKLINDAVNRNIDDELVAIDFETDNPSGFSPGDEGCWVRGWFWVAW